MKKLLIALTITATLPISVQANDASDAMKICKPIHSLAQTIMERRQEGASMVEMLEIANTSDNESANTFAILLVEGAYSSPRYHTRENQRRAAQDFGNENFKLCMDIMKENTK